MLVSVGLHSTPDGVSTPAVLVTINMELLTEFRAHTFNWESSRASGFHGTETQANHRSTASVKGCACDLSPFFHTRHIIPEGNLARSQTSTRAIQNLDGASVGSKNCSCSR